MDADPKGELEHLQADLATAQNEISALKSVESRLRREQKEMEKVISDLRKKVEGVVFQQSDPLPRNPPIHPDRKIVIEKNYNGRVQKHDLNQKRRILKEEIFPTTHSLKL